MDAQTYIDMDVWMEIQKYKPTYIVIKNIVKKSIFATANSSYPAQPYFLQFLTASLLLDVFFLVLFTSKPAITS